MLERRKEIKEEKKKKKSHLSLSSTDCPSSAAVALTTGIFVGPSTETVSGSLIVLFTLAFVTLALFVLLTFGAIFEEDDVITLLIFCAAFPIKT